MLILLVCIVSQWYFVMPNMRVVSKGRVYNGVLIPLRHGQSISWDGRVIRHCTTVTTPGVTDSGEANGVFGWFHAAKKKLVVHAQNQF
jgi:hypothetical protein